MLIHGIYIIGAVAIPQEARLFATRGVSQYLFKYLDNIIQRLQSNRAKSISPEMILENARRELHDYTTAVRQQILAVSSQMYRLRDLIEDQESRIRELDSLIESTLAHGDTDFTRNLLREKSAYQDMVLQTKTAYAQAREAINALEALLKHQEKNVRARAIKSLSSCEGWDSERIETELDNMLQDAA